MKLRKIFASFALVFLLAPLGLIGQGRVQAAEIPSEVTFVLHKRVFINPNEVPSIRVNSGLELTPDNVTEENEDLLDATKTFGANGIVFEVYDATEYVLAELKEGTLESAMQDVFESDPADLRTALTEDNLITTITTARDTETGENGVASLTLDFNEVDGENHAILFLEVLPTNGAIRQEAAPMLVSLPVEDTMNEGQFLDTVHLYPKNVLRGRLPETGGETPTPTPRPTPRPTPTPKPVGRLPQTGEAKTITGLLGILIVGSVLVFWNKRSTKKSGS